MEPACYKAAIGQTIIIFVRSSIVDQAGGQGTVCLIVVKLSVSFGHSGCIGGHAASKQHGSCKSCKECCFYLVILSHL